MDALQERCETTIVYFTYENIDLGFDHYLRLGHDEQTMEESYEALCERDGARSTPAPAGGRSTARGSRGSPGGGA
jgi:hypothetical protein